MNMRTNSGIIRTVVIIIIALIALGYFGFNLRDIVASPTVQDNLGYAWGLVTTLWTDYIREPAEYLWGIFKSLLWDSFIDNLEKIKNGEPTNIQLLAPTVGTTTPYVN